MPQFIVFHRGYIFYKLKATPSTSKITPGFIVILALLWGPGTEPEYLRCACACVSSLVPSQSIYVRPWDKDRNLYTLNPTQVRCHAVRVVWGQGILAPSLFPVSYKGG